MQPALCNQYHYIINRGCQFTRLIYNLRGQSKTFLQTFLGYFQLTLIVLSSLPLTTRGGPLLAALQELTKEVWPFICLILLPDSKSHKQTSLSVPHVTMLLPKVKHIWQKSINYWKLNRWIWTVSKDNQRFDCNYQLTKDNCRKKVSFNVFLKASKLLTSVHVAFLHYSIPLLHFQKRQFIVHLSVWASNFTSQTIQIEVKSNQMANKPSFVFWIQ